MFDSEITSEVSCKLNEINLDLNSQIRETIEQVISEQLLPTIRTLCDEKTVINTNVDLLSSRRHREPKC